MRNDNKKAQSYVVDWLLDFRTGFENKEAQLAIDAVLVLIGLEMKGKLEKK